MSLLPESQIGIWLNTPIKFIDTRSNKQSRVAQNDSDWGLASVANSRHSNATDVELSSMFFNRTTAARRPLSGEQSVEHNPSRTLYAHVKYNLLCDVLCRHNLLEKQSDASYKLTTLDLGCSQQLIRRHLKKRIADLDYVGLDRLPLVYPDLLSDLTHSESSEAFSLIQPNTVMALDVISELHTSVGDLQQTLAQWVTASKDTAPLFLFTVPQNGKSESDKLTMNPEEWQALLERHFVIEAVHSIGFLSALPYWLGSNDRVREPSWTQRLLDVLKEPMYNSPVLKSIDLIMTKALGKVGFLRRYSHSVLFVARAKT